MKKIRFVAPALVGALALFVSSVQAATLTENFATNPLQNGWHIFGDTNLFHWNSTNQDLEATWNSTNQNSYFYHPLGTILATNDAFSVSFDFRLDDIVAFNGGQQVSVGLFRLADATNADFSRSLAISPNLFEFDYFPDTGYGYSIDASLADMTVNATNQKDFYFAYDNLPIPTGVTCHITLTHAANTATISGQVLTNGVLYTSLPQVYAGPIADFRLDTLSISSYADDGYGDDVLAHGVVDNFSVTLPPPPVQNLGITFSNNTPEVQFIGRTNWIYRLQRATNLVSASWTDVSPATPGVTGSLILTDTNTPSGQVFYRIRAERP